MTAARVVRAAAWLLAALAVRAVAEEPSVAVLRDAALEALGGQRVERIEFTGSGWDACLGQGWSASAGWARWAIRDYRRVIDYRVPASVQTATRRPGVDPARLGGCGAEPGAPARNQESRVDPDSVFTEQLPIWLTPHGFLHLAEQQGLTSAARFGSGWRMTVPIRTDRFASVLDGYFGDDFLLDRIVTFIDDPVFGDMEVEARFQDYRAFGDLVFPGRLLYLQGGFATLELTVERAIANGPASPLPARQDGRAPGSHIGVAQPTPAKLVPSFGRIEHGGARADLPGYTEIGDGIFVLHGRYQAVAVEFNHFSVVIDGLQSDSRAAELIDLTHEAIPGKPIRYVVSTHSHFDHASGLRLLAAEGAAILTHQSNVAFFEQALRRPRVLSADWGSVSDLPISIHGIDGRSVISDGSTQTIELHTLGPNPHAEGMLIAYLPSIDTIVEADLLQPWIEPLVGGGRRRPHPYLVFLFDELERLELDYEQFVPIHQPAVPPTISKSALLRALGH